MTTVYLFPIYSICTSFLCPVSLLLFPSSGDGASLLFDKAVQSVVNLLSCFIEIRFSTTSTAKMGAAARSRTACFPFYWCALWCCFCCDTRVRLALSFFVPMDRPFLCRGVRADSCSVCLWPRRGSGGNTHQGSQEGLKTSRLPSIMLRKVRYLGNNTDELCAVFRAQMLNREQFMLYGTWSHAESSSSMSDFRTLRQVEMLCSEVSETPRNISVLWPSSHVVYHNNSPPSNWPFQSSPVSWWSGSTWRASH